MTAAVAAPDQSPHRAAWIRLAPATAAFAALALLAAGPGAAAPEEIQVYLDDLTAPGRLGLDVHNVLVPSGSDVAPWPGGDPPAHMYRLTPEFYYGVARDLELGLYLLSTHTPSEGVQFEGPKLRLKYIAPHDARSGLFWGANLEVGDTSRRVSPTPVNGELKGILGYRTGPWLLAVNPNLDWSLSAHGGPATLDVDVKVSRTVSAHTQLGLESYNELGPAATPRPFGRESKMLYAALDQDHGSWDLNAGIGRGLTSEADRWVVKVIVGFHFGPP